MNTKEYIEKYIVPNDSKENQLLYQSGDLEYDNDYIEEHKQHNQEWRREITYDDTRDVAIRCVESLIGMGILEDYEDCNGTFEVQDLIQMEINKVLKLDIDNNFKITIK